MEEPLFVDHREPLEIDEASQRIRQRFAEKAKQHRDIHDTITAVYRAVWNDFYSWEPEGCRQIIDTLAVMSPGLSEVAFFENLFHPHPHSEDDVVVDESMSGLSITAFDLDHNYQLTLICTEHILPRFEPHPKYEACTPSARTIKSDEIYTSPAQGVELVHTLGFIQYAGELGFDERDYAMQYKAFAWQCNSCDPDSSIIAIEAVKQLEDLSISNEVIENHHILPPILSKGHEGLLWRMRQRDFLYWPKTAFPEGRLEFSTHSDAYSLWRQVNEDVDVFCPNLNCIEVLCMAHKEPSAQLNPKIPQVRNLHMRWRKEEPCGVECFLLMTQDDMMTTQAQEVDLQALRDIMKILPDEKPCHLAKLCKIPCSELYVQRMRLIDPDEIYVEEQASHAQHIQEFFDDNNEYMKFTPIDFCHHTGPCDQRSGCLCFKEHIHCRRNCRCSIKCKLRFKGCRCKNNRCQKGSCSCFRAGRECDPELCTSHVQDKRDAYKRTFRHQCSNLKFQYSQFPPLIIKSGLWGLGTFAATDIIKNELVGEYIAEQFYNEDYDNSQLHNHCGLNYAFTLNEGQVLDAATVGNETRCINHSTGPIMNIEAQVKYVNGDHRIGFYSVKKIRAGQELLFDYGEHYWKLSM